MTAKHTPAPWKFDDLEMKIKGTEGNVIANVSPKMDYSRGMETQTANAKLIAAAPEMLEAIISLNYNVQRISTGYPPVDRALSEWAQITAILIKKATE